MTKTFVVIIFVSMIHFLFIFNLFLPLVHPHYVSVTEVDFNKDEGVFEISISMTAHDFEEALKRQFSKAIDLGPRGDSASMNFMVEHYIERQFQIRLDDNHFGLDYLGYDMEKDKVTVYLQTEIVDFMPVDIHVENRLMCEVFPEQQNIVRFQYGDVKKNVKLTLAQPVLHVHLESPK